MRLKLEFGLVVLLFLSGNLTAQNLAKIASDDAVAVSGGLSFNTIVYAQKGLVVPSREPFTWFASGNLTVSILDVSLPFTYTYSNIGGKFTQPFNRAALHPTYKWIKTHIGLTSMSFSPYTLTGHLFLGAGAELTPGKWNIQVMGGRLNKEIAYDALEDNLNQISFKRYGYGLKVGYENKGIGGAFTLFKAKDQLQSIPFVPLNSTINPQDNLVLSLSGKAKISKQWVLEAEYAGSALTQNTNSINELADQDQRWYYGWLNGNETTSFFQAYNASLKYALKFMNVAMKYEHIDPGYKTLGGYFFNNDLENYTLAPSFSFFKKKLNVSANTGFQRNNLDDKQAGTTNRWVGSLNVAYMPNQKLALNGTYSNFSTFTKNRPSTDPFVYVGADTLNFYQLTQAASGMISYRYGSDKIKNSIQFLYNYQESINLSGNIGGAGAFGTNLSTNLIGIPTHTHLGNLSYTTQFVDQLLSLTIAGNTNYTIISDYKALFFGPTINLQQSLMDKKASLSFGTTYNRQLTNGVLASNILNHRLSFTLNPKLKNEKLGKVNLSANANFMQRFAIDPTQVNLAELNLFINLNYSF